MRVLITGGTGYIGSHIAVDLIDAGHDVELLDNLDNSSAVVVDRIETITGSRPTFHNVDLCDAAATDFVFACAVDSKAPLDAVIHCAGLKAVGESVEKPMEYYRNNVGGTLNLLEAMRAHGTTRIVFSSSATVYGDPQFLPITESHPILATNPYGRTRLFEVACGKWDSITIWGRDWDTPDGTGVRDYIHVTDLASGHRAAIESLDDLPAVTTVNLGTGRGYSVMEVVEAVRHASGHPVPTSDRERRPGDVASSVADPALAFELLGWKADRDLVEMCTDSWRWRSQNPDGYR